MKNSTVLLIVGIVAVVFIGGYYIGSETGLIPTSSTGYPNSTQLSNSVLSSISLGTDMELHDLEDAVSELNIEIFGINDVSALDAITWYNYENTQDGWELLLNEHESSSGWNSYAYGWQKGTSARLVLTIDGTLVKTYADYDTVIVTSHAPLWVYESYFD